MEHADYCIIGGGIAGTTAAETIRKYDNSGSIIIISDEPYRLYSRIMLSKPNFFLEKIPFAHVWLKKEEWYKENKIALIAGRTAHTLDAQKKEITLDDGSAIAYGKLLLATGGYARTWPVKGADKKGICYLRTLDHAKEVIARVKATKQAIAIGSGFVSFEMCDMLHLAGVTVTLIMREPYYWYPLLDEASGKMIERALSKSGVTILRNTEVARVVGDDAVTGVVLNDGTELPCSLVMVGIGLECRADWLKNAGLTIGRGILANEYLETNVPSIWTAGDCAEFMDSILNERVQLGNWVNAQMQGKVAGQNMVGQKTKFKMVSFYTSQGLGMTIAFVGDVRPNDREIITRGSLEQNAYGRLIVGAEQKLLGATLINRTQEVGAIAKLIEKAVAIPPIRQQLANTDVPLQSLLS